MSKVYIYPFIFNSADHKVAFRSFGLGTRVALNYPTCRSLTLGLCQLLSMTQRPSYKHHSKCTLCPYFDVFGVLCNLRCVYIYTVCIVTQREIPQGQRFHHPFKPYDRPGSPVIIKLIACNKTPRKGHWFYCNRCNQNVMKQYYNTHGTA